MASFDQVINFIFPLMANYGWLVALIGGLLAGEEVIIPLAFLSANGFISLEVLFVFCFIGLVITDFLIFLTGKTKYVNNFLKTKRMSGIYSKFDFNISRITNEKDFMALFYSKFILGTRIITLIYLGTKKITLRRFLLIETIVIFAWLSIIISIGWLAGKGFLFLVNMFNNFVLGLTLIVILVLILLFIRKWLNNYLMKKQKQSI